MGALNEENLRATIIAAFPELAGSNFSLMTLGWDSLAVDVDDQFIFKFPRDEEGEEALIREAALLVRIRPAISMAVPDLTIHHGPPLFSRHEKIKGEHLLTADYEQMPEEIRQRLSEELAQFYSELHQLSPQQMKAAGAEPIGKWQTPETIRQYALPRLPAELRAIAEATLAAFEVLPPDPQGLVYGFFDGHGWNMAFDHGQSKLNGIYDFADSGIGPLHQEFVYSNFISPDLTERIVAGYERRTGRELSRQRLAILSGMIRLSELAEAEIEGDLEHAPMMLQYAIEWAQAHKSGGTNFFT
jgi:aminoglycoside phosphotransferase (APT) family kinase protein